MKKALATIFFLVGTVVMAFDALLPTGPTGKIVFAQAGKAQLAIIIPVNVSGDEQVAANELKTYLEQMTGGSFTIMSDKNPVTGKFISIGKTTLATPLPITALSDGAYAIDATAGNLYLRGGGRQGATHAVMALLEEDLHCRWYAETWQTIPHDPNLSAMVAARRSCPDFQVRFIFSRHTLTNTPDWPRHNRVMRWNKFNHVEGWFCHTYNNICGMEEFSARPDLFAKDAAGKPFNTQLCPTHPEILKRATERVLAALANNRFPEATLISISENDGSTGYCQCPRCTALIAKHQSPLAPHLTLVNAVANAINKDYPGISVDFLVYSAGLRKAPDDFPLADNVTLWYCANTENFNAAIPDTPQYRREFLEWRAKIKRINIWEYDVYFNNYFRVMPSLPAKIANLRFWKANHVDGVMYLEVVGVKGGDQQALRAWVLSKLLWDSSRNEDALARDFCDGVYGTAAPEMFDYYKLVEKAGKAGKSVEDFYGEVEFIKQAEQIFEHALVKAKNNIELCERIEQSYIPIIFMEAENIYRDYPGNRASFPSKRYTWLLSEIKRITARENGMTMYSELVSMDGRLKELDQLRDLNQTGGALRINAVNAMLYEYPIREDRLASTGRAPMLPCTGNWLVQWLVPVNLCVTDKHYRLRAQLRLDQDSKTPGQGVALIGLHSPNGGAKQSWQYSIVGKDLSSKEYRWIELPRTFVPTKNDYVWFAALSGSDIGGLYVDNLELIPEN